LFVEAVMVSPRIRWFTLLTFIFIAILVAALALGYYSYNMATRMVARSQESLETSNRLVGLKLIDRIEKVIIDSDRTLFRMVRLDDPREFKELWQRIVRISPVVQTVAVFDEDQKLVHLVSKLRRSKLKSFRRIFIQQIVPDMELPALRINAHKHLHKIYRKRPYLISYIRRHTSMGDYYIALNMNIKYLVNDVFREEFSELEESRYVAVLDESEKAIYGRPVPPEGGFIFEDRFPTTLYRWRLQIAPREVVSLREEAQERRTFNLVLVAVAVGVILVGMMVFLVAVRMEARANQLKSEFISNVTHELKTPLSLIRMFAELLALGRTADSKTSKEYAEIITRESDRLTRLIDNVLDFARIERGKAAYEFTQGNLTTVVERGVDLVRYRADQGGIRLQTEIEPGLPDTLLDENAMTLLLLNLLENALKYGSGEGGEIVVSLGRNDGQLKLRVSDQGAGIPREEISHIFDRFYRAKDARSNTARGSGIGLSLVKHIAEAHGGKVRVTSDLGKGATFEVNIPIREETIKISVRK
jgi:two-component system phosphate regulon sensor histidine kinase PhoR